MNTKIQPFADIPSGIDIAHYFMEMTDRRNPGCEGIDLWRDGKSYCYLWVEAMVDEDMWGSYLLDIRTNIHDPSKTFTETRDYLFVRSGIGNTFEVEWHNHKVDFDASTEEHLDRFHSGLHWFVERVVAAAEREAES